MTRICHSKKKIQQSLFLFSFICLLFLINSVAFAEIKNNVTYKKINAQEIKHLLNTNSSAMLIHTLSKIEFIQQHIPNSTNIPTDNMAKTLKLPKDKMTPLIFYCMGIRCNYSENSSKIAIKKGYEKVYWFQGGIPEWRSFGYEMYENELYKNIKIVKLRPYQIAKAIEEQDAYILDVRPLWYSGNQGYLSGAVNVPLLFLADYLPKIPTNRPIIVTDGYMKQSISGARYLTEKGYNVLGVLRGGMKLWNKNNFPTVDKSEIKALDPNTFELVKGGV